MSTPKPVEDRERRNMPTPLYIEVEIDDDGSTELAVPVRTVPDIPYELRETLSGSPALQKAWHALWSAPVAQLLDVESDSVPVIRLFKLYRLDEQLSEALEIHMQDFLKFMRDDAGRTAVEFASDRSSLDDKLLAGRLRVATECRMLENQIGITPKARLALGVALFVAANAASPDQLVHAANVMD